jgi:hypothetical protein
MRLIVAFAFLSFHHGSLLADQVDLATRATAVANLWFDSLAPADGRAASAFTTEIEVSASEALPKEIVGKRISLAWQGLSRLRISTSLNDETYSVGRLEDRLWGHAAGKKFGLIGDPSVPPFATDTQPDGITLPAFNLPIKREQLLLLPLLFVFEPMPTDSTDLPECIGLHVYPRPEARAAMKLPAFSLKIWLHADSNAPARIVYSGDKGAVTIDFHHPEFHPSGLPDSHWQIPAAEGDIVETVALSHLTRSLTAALSSLNQKLPSLGLATGKRRLIAQHQGGRLEDHDGTRVLFLKGTPEQMGQQHGHLMKKEVRHLVDRILYGVGVGSSFAKGRWFFGEIESAQARLQPFTNERYLREMDAMAAAAGIRVEESRLANFFPELFHCSGFALYGKATQGGTLYHGRILDYMKGVGLEQNACVMVIQPDQGHAWVNLGYAGFLGTVTAMNDQHIAIGEMGGRGEGNWDGKPMAQLMREVMESASTLDEAIEIMRTSPRTCEYYYVLSDGKTNRAVGIAATPEKFDLIWAGDTHPQLPRPVTDAVLLSAGDRYNALVERVTSGYGQFDAESSRNLMTHPVCMNSNIQSVLFAPQNLDFWVANADSQNVASHTRYTHYNLRELLDRPPAASAPPRSN